MNNAKIYLCKADCSILGYLTGIKTDTCNLKKNATDLWEITFEVDRFIEKNGQLVQSAFYDSIDDMMRLYLDSENTQAFFVIDSEPVVSGDGLQEVKTVTAHSIESELGHIYLKNFKINCGTYDSQEFLVVDAKGDLVNNIDAYNAKTMKYITLVDYEDTRYSLMHLVLQNTDWKVKDNIPDDICKIQKSFETSDSIYAFLMKNVSPGASVIFEFDRKNKEIGIVKAEGYGKDTGVFITMRNLMNSFEVTSSSDDAIMTKIVPTGANDLSIEQVNLGEDYIINLDYFMNTLNEYGDYKYVSKDLHDKYTAWKNCRDVEKYGNGNLTRRQLYAELSRLYNGTLLSESELINRVPNDGAVIDYKTFSLEELKFSLTAYNNALVALITLYKNDYGVTEIEDTYPYTPTPSTATNIQDTPYWYDFYAYKEKIIPQVTEALKMYCETDESGNLVVDSDGNYIELEFGNPDYYADETILKDIDAYLYEWSLYGLSELEAKEKAWSEAANILYKDCFIKSGTPSNPVYRTADDNGWNELTSTQKSEFTSKDAFITQLNLYLDYMSLDERENSLTHTISKGVIRQCDNAIEERSKEIADVKKLQESYSNDRDALAKEVSMNNFFSDEDIDIINSMLRKTDYSNEYILTTNLNDVISTVDVQEELYQDATKELNKLSQPQYSFATELDNLYSLGEFKAYQEPFDVGNFIRVGLEIHEDLYENNFVKLRLMSISYNPLESGKDLSVEFSTMTKTFNTVSDLAFLLNNQSSSGSGSSSGSSSGGGTYGNNDASVQMSNTMLNALLKTELFGTAVNDVILDSMKANKGNFNALFAHSGVFDSLEAGKIKVSGDCLFDYIKSSNYSSSTNKDGEILETGSILNLFDGTFSFAGGNLKWDNSKLYIGGEVTAIQGITETEFRGDVKANEFSAQKGTIAGWKFNADSQGFYIDDIDDTETGIKGKKYIGSNGLMLGDYFSVSSDGISLRSSQYNADIKNNKELNFTKINTDFKSGKPEAGGIDRIYVYEYQNLSDDTALYFSVSEQRYYTIKITETDEIFYCRITVISNYRFYPSDIQSITSADLTNGCLPDNLDEYIPLSSVGYIPFSDLQFVGNNAQDEIYNQIDNQIYNDYEPAYFETPGKNRTIKSISLPKDNNTAYDCLGIISVCFSDNTCEKISNPSSADETLFLDSVSGKFKINSTYMTAEGFSSKYMYDNVSVSGSPLYINSAGIIGRSGSSRRFKNSISANLTEVSDPHRLYDIDVVQYKYNDDYFSSPCDEGIGRYFIGFIAEDVAENFRDGATFDNNNRPDGWDLRYMFPALTKLVQEQHQDIENLKEEIKKLKQSIKFECSENVRTTDPERVK